ncbi:PE-PGRS family protein [Cystobacter fuscus]|nr:PE-PGRS family protein [Cystobacter fuscus]
MQGDKRWWLLGSGLALVVASGCLDFEGAHSECQRNGKCPVFPQECDPNFPDEPDDTFVDANCDGIDGTERKAIFVDAATGEDERPKVGEKMTPYRTLGAALAQAVESGKSIYLAQGDYTEQSIRLEKPVSLYGGYSGTNGNWARGPQYTTRITLPGIGLTVMNLGQDAGVTLDRLTIQATTPDAAGAPCIGVRVVDSSGVRLRNLAVTAGAGSPGASAPSTPPATDGGVGIRGNNGEAGGAGGQPGPSDCNPAGFGRGGNGGTSTTPSTRGQAGGPGVGGGSAGCDGGYGSGCADFDGAPGQNGLNGDAGTPGQEGDGLGRVAQGVWSANSGEQGKPGTGGTHGGGGGGGAFAAVGSGLNGGGGGGGGAGGCGGRGGLGGQGGGASIALLLINGHVSVEHCALRTLGGGKGGVGAPGAEGGQGGPGGEWGVGATSGGIRAGSGGKGGDGGKGGRGGNGGGGGGGPSVGVWCQDSSVSAQETTITLGDGGVPGVPSGHPGLREDSHQCPGFP